jgi:hypothetical protein
VDFGTVSFGQTSPDVVVNVTNNGASPSGVLQVSVVGANAGDFAETEACTSPLAAGASCPISVNFTPRGPGATTASLVISASPGGMVSATLRGNVDAVYGNLTDSTRWSSFDVGGVNMGAVGFAGAVFDGRYVYLVPYLSGTSTPGIVARYDTQGAFDANGSYSVFNVSSVNPGSNSFTGGAFDGRYIYLIPSSIIIGSPQAVVARYDTQAPFSTASSWTTMDVGMVTAGTPGFEGVVFDGRYLYLVPHGRGTYTGLVVRYDSQAPFMTKASWSTFDVGTLDAGAAGFQGGVFDGRYVYFVPFIDSSSYDGKVARYDTLGSFATTSSWAIFDVETVNPSAKAFGGGTFDGRYLYLIPYYNAGVFDSVAARYDTQADFASAGSWSTFDVSTVAAAAKGYLGGVFDGRYVFLVPATKTAPAMRYDTQADFAAIGSWSSFDMTSVDPGDNGFFGGAFDGRYVYFVPFSNAAGQGSGIVARFDAKEPPSMPASYHGSFF